MQEYGSYRVTCVLAISQLRTAKHLSIVWRDKAKWQRTLKVKIRARNYKRCLITSMHVCAPARVCACVCLACSQTLFIYDMTIRHVINKQRLRAG